MKKARKTTVVTHKLTKKAKARMCTQLLSTVFESLKFTLSKASKRDINYFRFVLYTLSSKNENYLEVFFFVRMYEFMKRYVNKLDIEKSTV